MSAQTKILLIDDDELGSKPLLIRLEKRGLVVHFRSSGFNIWPQLNAENYDLILLDYSMPDLTGHDVLKEIRSQRSQLELPIIMLSGNEDVQDIVESLKLGANDYIVKPANIDIAMARIQTQLMLSNYYNLTIRKKELEAIHAMVVTYSHEINNPLTIVLAHFSKLQAEFPEHPSIPKIDHSLKRAIDIINKIKSLSENESKIEFASYVKAGPKMIRIKKES